MDKKLTLSLNQMVIEKAKFYAKSNNTSLSKLIEAYLSSLVKAKSNTDDITPLVESLSGVIKIDADSNPKEDYTDFLMEKYK